MTYSNVHMLTCVDAETDPISDSSDMSHGQLASGAPARGMDDLSLFTEEILTFLAVKNIS